MFTEERKEAEKYLLRWKYLKKQAEAEKNYLSAVNLDGLPHGNKISKPTEELALTDFLSEKERRWINVIDEYYQFTDERNRLLIDGRNEIKHSKDGRGRPNWTDTVGQMYCEYMAEEKDMEIIMPHRNTLKMWWNYIVGDVVMLAMKKKIL